MPNPFQSVHTFVVQDTWDDEDDIELLEYLEKLPQNFQRLSSHEILHTLEHPSPTTMVFCDSHIVQAFLNSPEEVVSSYPLELSEFFGRKIVRCNLDQVSSNELPYFIKLAGSDKTVRARAVHNETDDLKLRSELSPNTSVYVSELVDFVSEWRLFLSPNRLWGCQEYSEYMVGHRLLNQNIDDDKVLVVQDVPQVPEDFCSAIREAAKPLGFVVVDVGLTSKGEWSVVECNPPFALSSYELDIGVYVEYCVAAWEDILVKRIKKPAE